MSLLTAPESWSDADRGFMQEALAEVLLLALKLVCSVHPRGQHGQQQPPSPLSAFSSAMTAPLLLLVSLCRQRRP